MIENTEAVLCIAQMEEIDHNLHLANPRRYGSHFVLQNSSLFAWQVWERLFNISLKSKGAVSTIRENIVNI